ncbi:MAG: esterase family protein [Armatimonadetes bacterium]|nr:esterase family protein [Armatimonadota bacterium]
MAWCEFRYRSSALQKHTAANIIVPEDVALAAPYPVMYLLHGLSDDHTIWMRRTSVERYLDGLPLIVVMPDGGRGFYTDATEGFAYEAAMLDDLIPLVDRTFPTRAERSGRCVGGLSMGGYGALRLAMRRPDLFCSAVSHSGAVYFGHRRLTPGDGRVHEFRRILGADPSGGPNDLHALASRLDKSVIPALRLDCGTEDPLLADNRSFHAALTRLGVPHEYEEFPGGHDWSYWDAHLPEAIGFHLRAISGATS